MMGFSKKLVQIGASAVLTVGNVLGADATFEKDFQEQVVDTMVKHDFAENAGDKYIITEGRPDKPSAWQWSGSKSIFFGTVKLEKDDDSASHLGRFSGKMIRKGNDEKGGNGDKPEELTWAGKITGQAVDFKIMYFRYKEGFTGILLTSLAKSNVSMDIITLELVYEYDGKKQSYPKPTPQTKNGNECSASHLIPRKSDGPWGYIIWFPAQWRAVGTAKTGNGKTLTASKVQPTLK